MKDIILVGGGGHCKSCIDVIESSNQFNIIGIIDKKENIGKKVLGYEVIGTDEDILTLSHKTDYFFITIGQIGIDNKRKKLYDFFEKNKLKLATIIAPTAIIGKESIIKKGTILMHYSVVGSNVTIHENCIINTKALIEHESVVNKHTHVSTGAILNGNVKIGVNCFIGSGSVVNLNTSVANETVIASSCLVTKSINKPGIYKGVPVNGL